MSRRAKGNTGAFTYILFAEGEEEKEEEELGRSA